MDNTRIKLDRCNIGKELILVEYPGFVKNDDKMIATLGGINKISEVLSGDAKRLEVRFHCKNVFNKPAFGDLQTTTGLLLKIKIRKPKKRNLDPPTHSIEILGHCSSTYRFDSLCDFQYLPFRKCAESGQTNFMYKDVITKGVMDTEYFYKSCDYLFCPPVGFARSDTVFNKLHRDDQEENTSEVLGVSHAKHYDSRDVVMFNLTDTLPSKPYTQSIKKMTVKYVSDQQLDIVRKLFDEHPIWNRIAILHESGIGHDKLKYILPTLAYYYSTGPWRTMYVRYGYDPRKNFNSRYYQTFDFRLTFGAGVAEYVKIKSLTKSSNSYQKHSDLVQDINYPYFEEEKLPRSRQCIFRYCDIHLSKVQDMLQKIPTPLTGATCNEKTGWLPVGFDDQCRQVIANNIKELMRDYYQKEQLSHDDEDDITDDDEPDEDDMVYDEEIEESSENLLENMDTD